jgi:protease PrsW
MEVIGALFFGFVPLFFFSSIIYWLDRYEKEPKILLGATFFWGAVVSVIGTLIVAGVLEETIWAVTQDEFLTTIAGYSVIAPVVEEGFKGLAVLIVFLFFYKEFDSVMDGIIYGAIAGLGFGATENTLYILQGFYDGGWAGFWELVYIRVVLVGWQHAFYTAFIGIGFAIARVNRNILVKLIAPLAGVFMAMFTHSLHNTLAVFSGAFVEGEDALYVVVGWDAFGWIFMILFMLWALWHEGQIVKKYLSLEAQHGLLTPAQYQTAHSFIAQFGAGIRSIFGGNFFVTSRFYQVCGELAHKNRQTAELRENHATQIERLRAELQSLAPKASA